MTKIIIVNFDNNNALDIVILSISIIEQKQMLCLWKLHVIFWLHKQNMLRTVYELVYCFLRIRKSRLHISCFSIMKNKMVIRTGNILHTTQQVSNK